MAEGKKQKKCLGRFETTYMKSMTAPDPSDYEPRTRDYGQFIKVLNNIEMNKKYQFPVGISKYSYDFCGEKYPMIGDKKKPVKPGLKYKPSCPQYAPYHSTTQDMSLIQRRLETEPEHEHTWYRTKKPPRVERPIVLFKPRSASPRCGRRTAAEREEEKQRIPERHFNRLQRVRHEENMQNDPRVIYGKYYERLHTPPEPKERPKFEQLLEEKREYRRPPPFKPPPEAPFIVPDKSRSSREATDYGWNNSMMLKAAAMISPPQKDPRDKPKLGVHSFFSQGSSGLQSENGTAMSECYYAHARPYAGTILTLSANKALNSKYF